MKTYQIAEIQVTYKPAKHDMPQICDMWQAYEVARPFFEPVLHYKEAVKVLYINRAGQAIGIENHSLGGMGEVTTDIRQILGIALKVNASGLILMHNHPSGVLAPSKSDKELTQSLKEACEVLRLQLLDHLIIAEGGFYSFVDHDLL